ncbi:hypothetical protein BC351_00840 [Paenibacillus ferrarius]|uniref:Uncharacterized protein n=1 Tax=Paenibacillus ferrarius TaxID=1469647 RepID=A0A1V4HS89_9BACL|nr:hypothetical protein [Paenibacillus ferrarius]OPH61819.1 hypothetical protein BC351_00840 [Paenibacillus ferrarius]
MIQFISGITIYIFLNALYMRGFYKFGKSKSAFEVGIIELIFPITLGLLTQFGILENVIALTAVIFTFTALRHPHFWQIHLIFSFSVTLSYIIINNSISYWVSQDYHHEITIAILLFASLILLITKKGIRISYSTNFLTHSSWIYRTIVLSVLLNVGLQFLKLNQIVLIVENILLFVFLFILVKLNIKFRRLLKSLIRPMTPELETQIKSFVSEYENRDKK